MQAFLGARELRFLVPLKSDLHLGDTSVALAAQVHGYTLPLTTLRSKGWRQRMWLQELYML